MLTILYLLLFRSQIHDAKAQRTSIDHTSFASNDKISKALSESTEFIYVDIDPNKIQGTFYYFDTSVYNPETNQIVVLKLDTKYDIQRLEVYYRDYSSSFYVEIPEDYTKLTLVGDERKFRYYNLICHANNLVLVGEEICMAYFHDARGRVEIKDDPRLEIGTVYPSSKSFTIYSEKEQKEIQTIIFEQDQANFIFEGNAAKVLDVEVKHNIHCKISNCQLSKAVTFEFGSTLEIDDSVYLGQSIIEVPYSNLKEKLNSPYIKSDILKIPPRKIKVIQENEKSDSLKSDNNNNKVWIGQSINKFSCGKWAAAIESSIENYKFNYECLKESENAFNLYAVPVSVPKEKKTLAGEYIALIIVSCLSAVVIIASIIIYFVVIRPKAKEHSEEEKT